MAANEEQTKMKSDFPGVRTLDHASDPGLHLAPVQLLNMDLSYLCKQGGHLIGYLRL